jgi:hypothetical protein
MPAALSRIWSTPSANGRCYTITVERMRYLVAQCAVKMNIGKAASGHKNCSVNSFNSNQTIPQMQTFRYSSKLGMYTLIFFLMLGGACKSKKKAMEAQAAAERTRMEQEARAQREKDAELQRQQEEERKRKEAESQRVAAPAERLNLYFSNIASSSNGNAANNSINEAMALFASPDTPVLIVISQQGDQKDYDKPTTIRNYLNYLKDTRNNSNKISDIKFDASGKITEMELIKQK